jgi:hypothetical protein
MPRREYLKVTPEEQDPKIPGNMPTILGGAGGTFLNDNGKADLIEYAKQAARLNEGREERNAF